MPFAVPTHEEYRPNNFSESHSLSKDELSIFPPGDFLGGTNGKLGKPGDVTVSFFPHVVYDTGANANTSLGHSIGGSDDQIDNPEIIGSLLITLGDHLAC